MLSSLLVALSLAAPGQCSTCGPMNFGPGMGAGGGSWSAGAGGMYPSYDSVSSGGGGGGDQLYPFDSPEPWQHGYFQEMPAYGGHASFRPHNYKHVLAQTQVAGGWGINPTMAYAHQWYHRYRNRSGMHPGFGSAQAGVSQPGFGNVAQAAPAPGTAAPYPIAAAARSNNARSAQLAMQQAAAFERGYPGTEIPGIRTPYYQRSEIPRNGSSLAAMAKYGERFDQLQQQLADQSFQMQILQQQLQQRQQQQQREPVQRPAWDQPAYSQFANAGQPTGAQTRAVQELPGPATYHPQPGTPANAWQGAWQQGIAPQMQQPPAQPMPYGSGSQYVGPQYPGQPYPAMPLQPQYGQPQYGQPASGMNYGPAQPGPVMQVPGGQAWPAQPMMPMNQPIPGVHAGWQQSPPMQPSGNWNTGAPQNGYANGVPQQVFFPQPYDNGPAQPMNAQPYYYAR